MMPKLLDVSPSRGNLLRLQDRLAQFQQGHELLDRKRQVLTHHLMDMLAAAEAAEKESRRLFREAYDALQAARMDIGLDRLRWISLAPSAEMHVKLRQRSIMGVITALVDVEIETLPIPYGPGDTDVSLDVAHLKWLEAARSLGQLAEKTVTAWRLAVELKKTQRRVNALAEIIIPQYQATIAYINNTLLEQEREEIVHAKKVKKLHGDSFGA